MTTPPSDRRLHPASVVFDVASHTRQLLLPGLLVLIAGARGGGWQVYAMLLFLPAMVASLARFLTFRYELGADELVIRRGVFVKQVRHVPYSRVQNIDAVQTIVHRLLGVAEVRLETGSGEEPEVQLRVIAWPAFEELRATIDTPRHRPAGAVAGTQAADLAAPDVVLLRLPNRELVRAGLIEGHGLVAIGALLGLLWEAGLGDRLDTLLFGGDRGGLVVDGWRVLRGRGFSLQRIALAAIAVAALVGLTRVFSVGWSLVRLHGFTLRKSGADLRLDFGLLTRVAAMVPVRRVQSVTVYEGPLHRLLHRVAIHVDTAGGGEGKAVELQRQWLAPVIARRDTAPLLADALPWTVDACDWLGVDLRGIRRARSVNIAWALVASALTVGALGWRAVGVFLALAVVAELDARRSVAAVRYGVGQVALHFRTGWLFRRETIAPFAKIQTVSLVESPFDRRARMATVQVETAGAAGERHQIRIRYLPRATAGDLAALLTWRAGRTAFRW